MQFTIDALREIYQHNPFIRYVTVFQNWLQPAELPWTISTNNWWGWTNGASVSKPRLRLLANILTFITSRITFFGRKSKD